MKHIHQLIDLIKYPPVTEKSVKLLEKNQYTFIVDRQITKPEIKKVIEFLFDVKVKRVNTQTQPKKSKRIGLKKGYKPQYKKAILVLNPEDTIEIFNN